MTDQKKNSDLPDAREILRGRTFGPEDALAREAGGALKGASPVATHDQAVYAARTFLEVHLPDPEGSLRNTLIAKIDDNPPLVAECHGDVPRILKAVLTQALASDTALADLVRETDARWGREYTERPHFDRPGQAPDPEDPYTLSGVRRQLDALLRDL